MWVLNIFFLQSLRETFTTIIQTNNSKTIWQRCIHMPQTYRWWYSNGNNKIVNDVLKCASRSVKICFFLNSYILHSQNDQLLLLVMQVLKTKTWIFATTTTTTTRFTWVYLSVNCLHGWLRFPYYSVLTLQPSPSWLCHNNKHVGCEYWLNG